MRHRKYRVLLALLFALASLPLFAQTVQPVRIGVSLSLSGKYAELGAMNEKAYRLWERDVNRRGGLLGRPVKITIVDDRSDPARAVNIYEDLITRQKVDLVLGPYSSGITEAVSDVTERYGYPLLTSGAAADSMWNGGKRYLFGVYIPSSKYAVGMLELMVQAGIQKIAVIADDDVFSQGVEAGIREWAKRFELDVVYRASFRKGSSEIEQRIRAARASGADALLVAGHFEDSVNAARALKKIGWTPKAFYATVGPAIQKYEDVLKADADDTFSSSQWEPGLPFPGAHEFTREFVASYGMMPSYHAASAYAAGQILEAAVRKTQSLDRNRLRDALSTLDTMTILGRYGVDREGRQVRHFAVTVQWQKGRKQIVAPPELATAKPVWR